MAAKIWYLKKCTVFIGPPCTYKMATETETGILCTCTHVNYIGHSLCELGLLRVSVE